MNQALPPILLVAALPTALLLLLSIAHLVRA